MNLFHLVYLLILVAFLILALWIKKGVMWGVLLALIIFISYKAITEGWEAWYFSPIIGIFVLSIMGFIHDSIEGDLW